MTKPPFGLIASVTGNNPVKLKHAVAASQSADTIEFRLDGMTGVLHTSEVIDLIVVCSKTKRVILTYRDVTQGGNQVATLDDHYDFWQKIPEPMLDLICSNSARVVVDFSHDLIVDIFKKNRLSFIPWDKVGVSHHFMNDTPTDRELKHKLVAMELTPAGAFIKLVTKIISPEDVYKIERVFKGRVDTRPLLAFGMGEELNRKASLVEWGGAGMYVYPDGQKPTAPGQWSISQAERDRQIMRTLGREVY